MIDTIWDVNLRTRRLIVVDAATDCWLWTGSQRNGYGRSTRRSGKHRELYERSRGPVPPGMELDHLCRVRRCVNPQHLEPVLRLENIRRSPNHNTNKAHCAAGHPYDAANTYYRPDRKGRDCRCCNLAAVQRYQARRLP